MKNMSDYLSRKKEEIDQVLERLLPSVVEYPELIHESMRYSVFAGGKRFRSILSLAVCEACEGNVANALDTASSLEMIHTYSLIHDDLPSMDNDDYRRNQLSNHKKYGENIAILSGDALLTLAFEVMDPRVVGLVARAIGSRGVVGGQVADIQLSQKQIEMSESILGRIHYNKTAKLIQVSCLVGTYFADVTPKIVEAIKCYGEKIGFAFQLMDDIFDCDNYVELFNKDKVYQLAQSCIREAKDKLKHLDINKRSRLEELANFVILRKN